MVELDDGGVAAFFDGAELALDDSAAEVWASIEALDAEDWQGAGTHYQAVASRWAPAVAVTWSNEGAGRRTAASFRPPGGELPICRRPSAPLGVNRSAFPDAFAAALPLRVLPRRGERFVVKNFCAQPVGSIRPRRRRTPNSTLAKARSTMSPITRTTIIIAMTRSASDNSRAK